MNITDLPEELIEEILFQLVLISSENSLKDIPLPKWTMLYYCRYPFIYYGLEQLKNTALVCKQFYSVSPRLLHNLTALKSEKRKDIYRIPFDNKPTLPSLETRLEILRETFNERKRIRESLSEEQISEIDDKLYDAFEDASPKYPNYELGSIFELIPLLKQGASSDIFPAGELNLNITKFKRNIFDELPFYYDLGKSQKEIMLFYYELVASNGIAWKTNKFYVGQGGNTLWEFITPAIESQRKYDVIKNPCIMFYACDLLVTMILGSIIHCIRDFPLDIIELFICKTFYQDNSSKNCFYTVDFLIPAISFATCSQWPIPISLEEYTLNNWHFRYLRISRPDVLDLAVYFLEQVKFDFTPAVVREIFQYLPQKHLSSKEIKKVAVLLIKMKTVRQCFFGLAKSDVLDVLKNLSRMRQRKMLQLLCKLEPEKMAEYRHDLLEFVESKEVRGLKENIIDLFRNLSVYDQVLAQK